MTHSIFTFAGFALILAGGAFAQGDDCNTAAPIAGTGAFVFDTTGYTTSTFDGGGSCSAGASTILNDAFWEWTAPASGTFVFDTFGTPWDTKLSIHRGSDCAAPCIGYSDDTSGSFQSEVTISGLIMGETVLIQLGGFLVFDYGGGTLNITSDPCSGAPDDALENNDICANASSVPDGTFPGLFVSASDKDHYAFCVENGGTVSVDLLFSNANGDVDCFLRDATSLECGNGNGADELAEGFSANDNESLTWTNLTGADLDVILEVNVWVNSPIACNNYDLIISGSGSCGNQPSIPICDPANPNSTGAPAVLSSSWGSGGGSNLHLEITG
ncbi:MAG: hypothetical protein P1V35_13870, partial [Planctomycetota bacterium]|nr:hypothetical protein [Planctomycetota bacterium]